MPIGISDAERIPVLRTGIQTVKCTAVREFRMNTVSRIPLIITTLCLLLMSFAARAETPRAKNGAFHVGGRLGLGLVAWGGDDASDETFTTTSKLGFSVGAFAKLDLDELLSLGIRPLSIEVSPEVLYATRGAGIEIGALTGSYDLSYLAVAVLPRIGYSLDRVAPYLVVGPELGFLLTGEIVNSMGNVTDIEEDFTSTDFGLVIGLGADVPLSSRGALVFELRATLGLVSIDGQGDGDDIKNRGLLLMLGYQY
jgi:hypothetical protein